MGKLNKLSRTSQIMNVEVRYRDEKFKFNLNEELKIEETRLNEFIKAQPQAYSFLLMLHKKLINRKKELELDRKELYDKLYIKMKDKSEVKLTVDALRAKIEKNLEYKLLRRQILKAESDCDDIETSVRGFEMRANLIQTLSSNLRREN